MKKVFALCLVLVMVFMSACSMIDLPIDLPFDLPFGDKNDDPVPATKPAATQPAATQPAATTEPTKAPAEEPTKAPGTAPTEAPAQAAEFPDVRYAVHVPLLAGFGNAVLEEYGDKDKNTFYMAYSGATADDLDFFLQLGTFCGMFPYGGKTENGWTRYYLMRPGSDLIVSVLRDVEKKVLYVYIPNECIGVEVEQMQVMYDYYMQDLAFPSKAGTNVLTQFYTSIGRSGPNWDGLISNIFRTESEMCWMEIYNNVDYPSLHQYLSDMMLCGFDVHYDKVNFNDSGIVSSVTFMLNNGTYRVAVSYDSETGVATVYYEPGIDRYLLSGDEYIKYIPQP